ncbi:SGNH/GDSL hydrolase family protein [Agromyces sp. SYSU T0242]|uniref:SGNH/GDSL hydrolase family protein n=1 Tax=Agromyces litoreus TaxID=3158561 RepID=UPI003392AB83
MFRADGVDSSASGVRDPSPRVALLFAALLAALALILGSSLVGPTDAASAAVPAAKPDKPGGGGGGNGGGKGGGKGGGNGGGTTALQYAAVGDSFAAGAGGGSYLDTTCDRSSKSYPMLLDGDADKSLVAFPACSGADTSDVIAQAAAVPATAKLITVTVGGNDVGFADVMQDCFVLRNTSCQASIDAGAAIAASPGFTQSIVSVVETLRAQAPGATVIVTGYPLLFWENSSGVNPKYAYADEVNDETVVLNDVIQAAAESSGAVFVDVEDDFAGHGIGSSSPWITDYVLLNFTSAFHPNPSGYVAYAAAIRAVPLP